MAATSAKNILLAVGSARGDDRPVDRALQLAKQWNATLATLHVTDGSTRKRGDQNLSMDAVHDAIAEELSSHPQWKGVSTNLEVVSGDPAEQILIKSRQTKPDLIVMGIGHHDNLQQRVLGSTIDRVIRAAEAPVLSVRSRSFAAYESVLVLTDFSSPSQQALDTGLSLCPGAVTTVLHVSEAVPNVMAEDKLAALKEELRKKLNDTIDNALTGRGIQAQISRPATLIEFGKPIDVIEYYVAENRPQLVVVGTHGRTGFLRAVLGSIAERLLKILPCDMLVVGSPERAD